MSAAVIKFVFGSSTGNWNSEKCVTHCNQVFSLAMVFVSNTSSWNPINVFTSISPFNLFVVAVQLENKYLKKFSDNFLFNSPHKKWIIKYTKCI